MPLDISRIHAICFDIDGTLSDTDDHLVYHFSRWLSLVRWLFPHRNPRPFARSVIMAVESPANVIYSSLDRIGLDNVFEKIRRNLSNFLARQGWGFRPPTFWLIPGAAQMLASLGNRYPLAIVSARDPRGTYAFLEQFDLSGFFRAVAHSQTCNHTKPFPDSIYWAARQLSVAPENCLMVGDTTVDIRAGKAAGAQTLGVLCGFGLENELLHAGADMILPSTTDIIEVLGMPALNLPDLVNEVERQPS
jgi:phosphoglycolate phosphatase-like HAD superfamily hydrolase